VIDADSALTALDIRSTMGGEFNALIVPVFIDMHLHAMWLGPGLQEPLTGLRAPETSDCLRDATLAAMDRYNIIKGVMSGPLIEEYKAAAQDRIIAGFPLGAAFGIGHPLDIGPEAARAYFGEK
jgi:hypothetical protein